jgi:hypothetical protein
MEIIFLEIRAGGSVMKGRVRQFSLCAIVVVVLAGMFFTTNLWGSDTNKLSGITVKDEYPNGCVDCHVKVNDNEDNRISTAVAKMENHPPIDKVVKVVPEGCIMCHKEDSKAGAFHSITHKTHYKNPSENDFISKHNGDCLNCHTLDMTNFKMGFKNGPANW